MAFLALLILVVPIVELYAFVKVSDAVGFLDALGILIVVSLLGVWLVKRAGLRVWARFNEQLVAGTTPSKEVADGVCLLLAGVLLVIPGFVTDALGLFLLLPPVRAVVRRVVVRRYAGRGPVRIIHASYRRVGGDSVIDTSGVDEGRRPPASSGELGRP